MTASLSKEPFKASSKRLPCPICGRTEDEDCRISDSFVLCYVGSTHQPPTQKKGEVIVGKDGQKWACTGVVTEDERTQAMFAPDKPLPNKRFRDSLKPYEPEAEISLALLPQGAKTVEGNTTASGIFYSYGPLLQVQRRDQGKKKQFYCKHRDKELHHWKDGDGGFDWPLYNEDAAVQYGKGKYILETEGEKCCDIASQNGIVCISQPGARRTEAEIVVRYLRLKEAGIKGVVYLEDNDTKGRAKGESAKDAANKAGLPLRAINAGDIWKDLPKGGSLDDIPNLSNTVKDIQAAANKPVLERVSTKAANDEKPEEPRKKESVSDETDEKQALYKRLIDEIVMAKIDGDNQRTAVLMSQTWQMGIKTETTEDLVLARWKELNNIGSSAVLAPVQGRKISEDGESGLTQLIPGFILDGALNLIVADAGVGKSHMSLVMAHRVINGGGFLDQEEGPTRKGKVLYIGTDGGPSAYDMLSSYCKGIADFNEWDGLELWCEKTGATRAWSLSLYNLEVLRKRLSQGDISLVIIDTCNAVFQLEGLSPYMGPVDPYLRLLKDLVCKSCPLVLLHHTNRSGNGIKSIGGHPAYQEVPDVIHRIEAKKDQEGTIIYTWHVEKLRGETKRSFSYVSTDGDLRIVDGHFYTNCGDKLLAEIEKRRAALDPHGYPLVGMGTTPKDLATAIGDVPSSVRTALTRLRQKGMVVPKNRGYALTKKGEARLLEISL